MKTTTHPTHHQAYRPQRAAWAVGIGVAGVFLCILAAMLDTRESSAAVRALTSSAVWGGALAFLAGTIVACAIEVRHLFARCPSCRRLLVRTRIDYQRSYYPCRRCDVTWTCPCRKGARSI